MQSPFDWICSKDLRAPDLHGRTPLAIARMNGMILQD